jgi:hypothetical protein
MVQVTRAVHSTLNAGHCGLLSAAYTHDLVRVRELRRQRHPRRPREALSGCLVGWFTLRTVLGLGARVAMRITLVASCWLHSTSSASYNPWHYCRHTASCSGSAACSMSLDAGRSSAHPFDLSLVQVSACDEQYLAGRLLGSHGSRGHLVVLIQNS